MMQQVIRWRPLLKTALWLQMVHLWLKMVSTLSDKKITNVADGIIAAGSKDAVNGGQLHTAVETLKLKVSGLTAEDGASLRNPLVIL